MCPLMCEEGLCPKTGRPKQACSLQCLRAASAAAEAAANAERNAARVAAEAAADAEREAASAKAIAGLEPAFVAEVRSDEAVIEGGSADDWEWEWNRHLGGKDTRVNPTWLRGDFSVQHSTFPHEAEVTEVPASSNRAAGPGLDDLDDDDEGVFESPRDRYRIRHLVDAEVPASSAQGRGASGEDSGSDDNGGYVRRILRDPQRVEDWRILGRIMSFLGADHIPIRQLSSKWAGTKDGPVPGWGTSYETECVLCHERIEQDEDYYRGVSRGGRALVRVWCVACGRKRVEIADKVRQGFVLSEVQLPEVDLEAEAVAIKVYGMYLRAQKRLTHATPYQMPWNRTFVVEFGTLLRQRAAKGDGWIKVANSIFGQRTGVTSSWWEEIQGYMKHEAARDRRGRLQRQEKARGKAAHAAAALIDRVRK